VSATPNPPATLNVAGDGSRTDDPFHNPSYPARTHFHEREALEASLIEAEERLTAARQKLSAMANHPQRAEIVRIYHQMMGARDQIADSARRMPLEAAALYEEDKHRYVQAVAAFERTCRKWQSIVG
jgi:hypothetical protein